MKQGERWIVYYGDFSTFSCDDGEPWEAPRLDVMAIASYSEKVGFYWIYSADYFYFEADRGGWQKADSFTLWDHLLRAKYPCVLFGRMLSDAHWDELWQRIQKDFGELEKNGWLEREGDVRRKRKQ